MNKNNSVKDIIEILDQENRPEIEAPLIIATEWGSIRTLDRAGGAVVRKISIDPGATAERSGPVEQLTVLDGAGRLSVDGANAVIAEGTVTANGRGYRAEADGTGLELLEVERR